MKNIVLIILMFVACLVSGQDMKSVTVPLSGGNSVGLLDIEIKSGSITIKGTQRQDVLVNYRVVENEDEDDEGIDPEMQGLKKINNNSFDFSLEEDNNVVSIQSETWFKGIDLVIEVPQSFNLDINNGMGGDVKVDNVSGELNLASYLGSVHATNVSGIVNANSYTGEIVIDFNKIEGGKDMSFVSYTGKIDVSLPAEYAASLKMKTDWGDIYSDLEITTQEVKPEFKKDDSGKGFKMFSDSWTYGTINGGGPELTLKTQMGSIYLRKN